MLFVGAVLCLICGGLLVFEEGRRSEFDQEDSWGILATVLLVLSLVLAAWGGYTLKDHQAKEKPLFSGSITAPR